MLPILAKLLASDHFLPHVFALRAKRQVYRYGVLVLAAVVVVVGISGIYELEPIRHSYLNEKLKLTADEAKAMVKATTDFPSLDGMRGEQLVTALFQYRFNEGDGLKGHNFGNLFLTALTAVTGPAGAAIAETS